MSDPYLPYVLGAYGATALIVGGLLWISLAANARVRRELDAAEKERRQ
ncbi:MAG: heme exporter protein CcmD [Pseudomonadota bacterium]